MTFTAFAAERRTQGRARGLSRLARVNGDLDAAKLYARVAVKIAALTGRRIGEKGWARHEP